MANDYSEAIEKGVRTMLWGEAWGEHIMAHHCADIEEEDDHELLMSVPDEAYDAAKKLIAAYEEANGVSISTLYERALAADEADETVDPEDSEPDAFGGDLVFMALGTEMSWFDEHAEFPLVVPTFDNSELREIADEICDEEQGAA